MLLSILHRRVCQQTFPLDLKLTEHQWHRDQPLRTRRQRGLDSTLQGHPWVADRKACSGFVQASFRAVLPFLLKGNCRLMIVNGHLERLQRPRSLSCLTLPPLLILCACNRLSLVRPHISALLETWIGKGGELHRQNDP